MRQLESTVGNAKAKTYEAVQNAEMADRAREAAIAQAASLRARATQAAQAASTPLKILANGWEEVRGPQGVYFSHRASGETAWEPPLAQAPTAAEADSMLQATRFRFEEAAKVAAAKTQQARDAGQAAEAAAAAEARLAQAAQAGRLHLEQLEAKEQQATSAADQARAAAEHAASMARQLGESVAQSETSSLMVLAHGWQIVTGPSGTYYFNPSSGETAWEKPTQPAPTAAEAEANVKRASNVAAEANGRAVAAVQAATEAQQKAAAAAQEEARLEQAVQAAWAAGAEADQKVAKAAQAAAQARAVAGAAAEQAEAKEAEARIAAEPFATMREGWQEVRSPQGVYYCNQTTNETVWERPLNPRS